MNVMIGKYVKCESANGEMLSQGENKLFIKTTKMIKVSVFYPNGEGKSFDMDYYCDKHIPLVKSNVGEALKSVSVEQGLAGGTPGSAPEYLVMGHLFFDSVESFQLSFVPHMTLFMSDVPNFTNIIPVAQISEVKM